MAKFPWMIKLVDALKLMDARDKDDNLIPFSIRYVTHNRKSGTGGEVIDIDQAIRCITKRGGEIVYNVKKMAAASKKNPNHHSNSTRNLQIVGTDQIRKCNIRLITEFNGQKVIW